MSLSFGACSTLRVLSSVTCSPHLCPVVQAARLLSTAEGSSDAATLLSTTGTVLAGLCAGLPSTNSQPVAVLGYRVQLQAARRALDTAARAARWPLVELSEISNGSLLRPSADWTGWSWQCGTDPELQTDRLCRDLCVATWVSEEDLLTASADRLPSDASPRRSELCYTRAAGGTAGTLWGYGVRREGVLLLYRPPPAD